MNFCSQEADNIFLCMLTLQLSFLYYNCHSYTVNIMLSQNTIQLPLAVNSTIRPLALAAGFTKTYNNMVELRQQVTTLIIFIILHSSNLCLINSFNFYPQRIIPCC